MHLSGDSCRNVSRSLYRIPKDINAIIISRTEPAAPFARLRANQQLSQINWADLQFTLVEELAFTQQLYPCRNITKQQLQKLNTHIRGWISGLILLLEQGAELDEVELDNKEMSPEYLFDYFATEIFYKIDEQTHKTWSVNFGYGNGSVSNKSFGFFVRLVRSEQ